MSWVKEVQEAFAPKPWMTPSDPFDTPNQARSGRASVRHGERAELPAFTTEQELAEYVISELSPHFEVHREVSGTHCSGRRLRIDAIMTPRDHSGWADGAETAFGVEFKLPKGGRTTTRWIAQCSDYTHTDWDGFGRLAIFACPELSFGWSDGAEFAVVRILGQLRVGELTKSRWQGWELIMSDSRQWSEKRGVIQAEKTHLRPTAGSR